MQDIANHFKTHQPLGRLRTVYRLQALPPQAYLLPPWAVRYGPERFFYDQRSHLTLHRRLLQIQCCILCCFSCSSQIQLDMLIDNLELQIRMGSIDCLRYLWAFTHNNDRFIPLRLQICLKLYGAYSVESAAQAILVFIEMALPPQWRRRYRSPEICP